MAGVFTIGETKARPGVYTRYENAGGPQQAGAVNGIGAAVIKANWGPLNQLVELDGEPAVAPAFGAELTVDTITEMFTGGCSKVKAVRAGSGGTKATIALKDGASADVVAITAKYVGDRAFSATIRDSLLNSEKKECIIYAGTREFEKIEFTKGTAGEGEPAALVAAFANSKNFTATKTADGNKVVAEIAQSDMAPGTNPTVTTSDYSTALNVLEAGKWNVLCVDTEDTAVHALVQPFIERIYLAGAMPMAIVAEKKDIDLDTRMNDAAAFNDEKMHYALNSAYDATGKLYDGYKLAARIGGMIAAVPSNTSLTHEVVNGFVALAEPLTNSQIEKALAKGCIVLTTNASDQIWIESAINTLITPSGNQDEGWKKIRRTKTRFELMDRIVATTDPLVGKVNNDSDGRAAFIAAAQGIVNTMIGEKKLLPGGIVYEDPQNPPAGDSAWFIIAVDDIDSIEKAYLTFRFRFAPAA
ncbi:MAG: phage tail sheath subtilisin-like domain-containing protein [Oscillospiraceae bacterium]|jgi:hypothetical protein